MANADFFRNRYAAILTLALGAQAAVFYGSSRPEKVPLGPPLSGFPVQVGAWRLGQEGYVDEETKSVLRADDMLNRTYASRTWQARVSLFVAFFRSQRAGQAPHSPKNCLPGAGWEPSDTGYLTIDIPGQGAIKVNRYVVSKGDQKSVVVYWYQTPKRVIASEYEAKIRLVADAIRYNRTDTALVRIVVPVGAGGEQKATGDAVRFVQDLFVPLRQYLPV